MVLDRIYCPPKTYTHPNYSCIPTWYEDDLGVAKGTLSVVVHRQAIHGPLLMKKRLALKGPAYLALLAPSGWLAQTSSQLLASMPWLWPLCPCLPTSFPPEMEVGVT